MPKLKPDVSQARRQTILAAAERCFRIRGFHQASIKDICTIGGFSPGALYLYFSSKEALIEGLIESQMVEARELMSALPEQHDLLGTLVDLISAWVEESRAQGNISLSADIFAEGLRNPRVARVIASENREMLLLYVAAVEAAQSRGEISTAHDAHTVATLLLALCDGLLVRFVIDPDFDAGRMLALLRSLLGTAVKSFAAPRLVSSHSPSEGQNVISRTH
jgi:TetR/AcrR family transcriptional regulator, repressor for uid operon